MNQKTILIVDDEPSICETMSDLLDLKGYEILIADNGVDGLKLCADHHIDLIVLDLNMPRMDGYLFLERLNERHTLTGKPMPQVLIMTAVDYKRDLGLSKNLGAARFMNKPFKQHDFLSAVESLLK